MRWCWTSGCCLSEPGSLKESESVCVAEPRMPVRGMVLCRTRARNLVTETRTPGDHGVTLLLAILGAVGCVLIGTGVLTLVGDRMAGRGAMPTRRARRRAWVRIAVGAVPMFAGIALVEGETGHRAEYVYFWWAGACVMALSGLFLVARLTSPPVRGRAGRWRGPFNVRRVAVTALVFAMLLCASWVVRSAPLMRDRGWWAPIPSWALLLFPSSLPDQIIGGYWFESSKGPWAHTYRTLGAHRPATLVERAIHGWLSDDQSTRLIEELERRTIETGEYFPAMTLAQLGGALAARGGSAARQG